MSIASHVSMVARYCLFALVAGVTAAIAGVPEAVQLLQQNRAAEAKDELIRSAAAGDMAAQGMLALLEWQGLGGQVDRPEACRVAPTAAEAGDSMGQAVLAGCYMNGIGVQQDYSRAKALARASALAGNNQGSLMYYGAVISDPGRRYIVNGKVDFQKYQALAARPIEQRADEVEAVDLLARAAEMDHRESRIALAAYLIDAIGEANRARAQRLLAGLPLSEQLQRLRQNVDQADAVAAGSLATIRLLRDAQQSAVMGALLRVYPPGLGAKHDCKNVRLRSATVTTPPQDAQYLPHTHPLTQRSYLVKGWWEEDWTYDVCGTQAIVPLRFNADGFGGAHFNTRYQPAGK